METEALARKEAAKWPHPVLGVAITGVATGLLWTASGMVQDTIALAGLGVALLLIFLSVEYLRRCLIQGSLLVVIAGGAWWMLKKQADPAAVGADIRHSASQAVESAKRMLPQAVTQEIPSEAAGGSAPLNIGFSGGGEAVNNAPAPPNPRSILKRIALRDESLRKLAAQQITGCRGHDQLCQFTRILEFVLAEIRLPQPGMQKTGPVQTPSQTLKEKSGDRLDRVVLLMSLAGAAGIRTYLVSDHEQPYALACFRKKIEMHLAEMANRGEPTVWLDAYQSRLVAPPVPVMIRLEACYAPELDVHGGWLVRPPARSGSNVYDPESGDLVVSF
ncbi:MAG: hypothetical protein GMKNLPBB_01321 [Myxococcota bacterium]|nr:hypothetical protein [Myxococcota bacterium]